MRSDLRSGRAARGGALAGVLAAIALLLFGLATPAQADETPPQIANALVDSRLHVTDAAGNVSAADRARMLAALDRADAADIRAVVIKNDVPAAQTQAMLRQVANAVGKGDTYVSVSADGSELYAVSRKLSATEINQLQVRGTPGASAADQLVGFVDRAEEKAEEEKRQSALGAYATLGFLFVVAAFAGGAFLVVRKRRRERDARQMAELKQGVEEDVTLLGEDIARLDLPVLDHDLDPQIRSDYERAMNSYDEAKTATERAQRPDDMTKVTTALEDGRYHMLATRARLSGEPVPERRAPCFFNPQHGPSAQDVVWAPPGGMARSVPACAADAHRVLNGQAPDIRMVPAGDSRRPYWDAGPAYGPYAGGYYRSYGGMDLVSGMLIGTMLGSMMSGGFGGGYAGGDMGGMGGGDMGGWDAGGGDFGGGGGFGDFGF
ncbi:hypothetical protein [Actinomadura flavalba]|uniref:hypothetical protein n=1 Tax=Actinomadura flavalba TaxID=1120938 RepID=UPI000380B987|nr:hypothetical protein [Actinomadura flavalba]